MNDYAFKGKKVLGKVKAFVRDNNDPEKRGRIRTYCPQVMGPEDVPAQWLYWAEPNFPWMGGINTLDFGPPLTKQQNGNVEVGVWIEFEQGELDFPIWTGTWIPAPIPSDPNAQQDLTNAATQNGGSIIDAPPSGSNLGQLNPFQPIPGSNETRFVTKAGKDIFIGSVQGGGILVGPSGVQIVGAQITINGKLINASLADGDIG